MRGARVYWGGVLQSLPPRTAAGLRTPPPPVATAPRCGPAPSRAKTGWWRLPACGEPPQKHSVSLGGLPRTGVSGLARPRPCTRRPHGTTPGLAAQGPLRPGSYAESGTRPGPPPGRGWGGSKANLTPRSPGALPWAESEVNLALRPAPSVGAVPKGERDTASRPFVLGPALPPHPNPHPALTC